MQSQFFAKHPESENGNGQDRAEPKTIAHRHVFGVRSFFGDDVHGFERHSALWARAGTEPNNFRMHWAGVADLLLSWGRYGGWRGRLYRGQLRCGAGWRGDWRRVQIAFGIGGEFLRAAFRAKEVSFAVMLEISCGFRRINGHSTNRIACHSFLTNF